MRCNSHEIAEDVAQVQVTVAQLVAARQTVQRGQCECREVGRQVWRGPDPVRQLVPRVGQRGRRPHGVQPYLDLRQHPARTPKQPRSGADEREQVRAGHALEPNASGLVVAIRMYETHQRATTQIGADP
jgi:hypothetical protein